MEMINIHRGHELPLGERKTADEILLGRLLLLKTQQKLNSQVSSGN